MDWRRSRSTSPTRNSTCRSRGAKGRRRRSCATSSRPRASYFIERNVAPTSALAKPAADARRRVPGSHPPLDPDAPADDYLLIWTPPCEMPKKADQETETALVAAEF